MENKQSYNLNEVLAKFKCITDFFQITPEAVELHDPPLDIDIDDMGLWGNGE